MPTRIFKKDLFIKATPERVFKALTQKEELEHWFVPHAMIELKPGGMFCIEWTPGTGEQGTIKAVDPPHLFSFTWEKLSPTPTTITFELTQEKEGTLLTLTHSGIGEGEGWGVYDTIDKGWEGHLKDLTSWVETGASLTPGPRG